MKLINGTKIRNPTKTQQQLGQLTTKPFGAAKSDIYMNWKMMICMTHPTTKLLEMIRKILRDRKVFTNSKLPEKTERMIRADPRMKVGLETP